MVIITYQSTALSENDFSICNAIGAKMGMQKLRQVSATILPQILQGIVSRPILYPQRSHQSVKAKRDLAAMPMVFGDNCTVGLVARREYGLILEGLTRELWSRHPV